MKAAHRSQRFRGVVASGTAVGLRGFTLIELLVVVVLIGLITMIALPRFTGARSKAYRAQVQTDLRSLVEAQEAYWDSYKGYANDVALLEHYNRTPNVQITILETHANGWSAKGTHASDATVDCAFYIGPVTPPAVPGILEGRIECMSS